LRFCQSFFFFSFFSFLFDFLTCMCWQNSFMSFFLTIIQWRIGFLLTPSIAYWFFVTNFVTKVSIMF
jgi:hypothetical protein